MRTRRTCIFAIATLAMACKTTWTETNLDHCTYNGGDEYCAANYPDTPLCSTGEGMCAVGSKTGCFAELAPECRSPCGEPGDMSCIDGSSSGSGSDSGSGSSEGATETAGSSSSDDGGMTSTTGEVPCMGDEDCTDAATPFCSPEGACVDCGQLVDGNAACAEADPGLPVCDAGACVACTDQEPGACGGQTPVCGEDNLCQACTEHSECPGTACHLDGPQVGACFDVEEVVPIANAPELDAALGALGAMDRVVLVLNPGTYATSVDVALGAEVAILAPGSATLSGDGGLNTIELIGSSITYLQGVDIANIAGNGLACSGTSVWLDDSEVRNNAQTGLDIAGGCAAHLRRSVVRANAAGGAVVTGATSSLALASTLIVDNVGGAAGPGVRVTSSQVDIAYSLIANNGTFANPDNLECLSGASGGVRNSIIVGPSGDSILTCNALSWTTTSTDTTIMGAPGAVNVGPYDAAWFVNPSVGNYHLSATGVGEFMDDAMWQPGDPLLDIDGDPIPTDVPSFPGVDQP